MPGELYNIELYFDMFQTPIGKLCIFFVNPKQPVVVKVSFGDYYIEDALFHRVSLPDRIKQEFLWYLEGKTKKVKVPYVLSGTEFCKKVWFKTMQIPYAQVRTYRWVAEQIGNPLSYRAVGQALKKNPIPIIVPCHRVVASDGQLGGFSGGAEIKRMLLEIEHKAIIEL